MNLRGLLNKIMYKDRARIYRQVRQSGYVDEFKQELIWEDIPCKLSQYGHELSSHRDDRAQKLRTDLRLCCDPAVDIQANDLIKISREGTEWELIAAEPFRYPTHQEISLRRRKEAGQQ